MGKYKDFTTEQLIHYISVNSNLLRAGEHLQKDTRGMDQELVQKHRAMLDKRIKDVNEMKQELLSRTSSN